MTDRMAAFFRFDADAWPEVAAFMESTGQAWPFAAILMDLRWWEDQTYATGGRITRPGRPALRKRWGVTDYVARKALRSAELWSDPKKAREIENRQRSDSGATEHRQRGDRAPTAATRSDRNNGAVSDSGATAERQNTDSGATEERLTRVGDQNQNQNQNQNQKHVRLNPDASGAVQEPEQPPPTAPASPTAAAPEPGTLFGAPEDPPDDDPWQAVVDEWGDLRSTFRAAAGMRPGPMRTKRTSTPGKAINARIREHGHDAVLLVVRWLYQSEHSRAKWLREGGYDRPATVCRESKFPDYLDLAEAWESEGAKVIDHTLDKRAEAAWAWFIETNTFVRLDLIPDRYAEDPEEHQRRAAGVLAVHGGGFYNTKQMWASDVEAARPRFLAAYKAEPAIRRVA